MRRRAFLAAPFAWLGADAFAADFPAVLPGASLAFPRDHGSHPAYRTEWWYATGWVREAGGRELGVQVTFFRNRPHVAEDNPSAFAPRQLVFAHAAIADPGFGRLRHDQRAARAMFDLAGADEGTTRAWIGDWSFALDGTTYRARIPAREFALDLTLEATQPLLLQGAAGYSRKGPLAAAGKLVLQPAAARRPRRGGDRCAPRERRGPGMARSRMVERGDGARSGRLGLDRDQPRRRWRADGFPHARPHAAARCGRVAPGAPLRAPRSSARAT